MKLQQTRSSCLAGLILLGAIGGVDSALAEEGVDYGFNRIIPGWTNYSTAFNATHDPDAGGEFATVACLYTPAVEVKPREFRLAVVWYGSGGQRLDFSAFGYEIQIWRTLDAFIANPRQGDAGGAQFTVPTGGTVSPESITRGGRPVHVLRFTLPDNLLSLSRCETYLIGFIARAKSINSGELYVPTAPHEGYSDVQAGNVVPFGWTYLVNAGGQTIYSGRLAAALAVEPIGERPRLRILRRDSEVCLLWPASSGCYALERCEESLVDGDWMDVGAVPFVDGEWNQVCVPSAQAARWYRLRQRNENDVVPP